MQLDGAGNEGLVGVQSNPVLALVKHGRAQSVTVIVNYYHWLETLVPT